MSATNSRIGIACFISAALTACAGSSTPAPTAPRGAPNSVFVTLRIAVPKAPAKVKNKPFFISPATQSVAVTITPVGSHNGTTVVGNCTQGFCTQTVPAPIGDDTFAVSLYSQSNANGTLLSNGSTTTQILAGANNVVSITFDPVVQSASATLVAPLGAGQATSAPVSIVPLDPSGATIVGPGAFIDAAGSPVAVSIALNDPTGNGKLTGPTSFASPSASGTYPVIFTENGTPPNFSYPSLVTSVAGSVSSTTTIALTPTQSGSPAPVPGGNVRVTTTGPDGNVWFVSGAAQNYAIGQYVPTSGKIRLFPLPQSVVPSDLVSGGDGKLYFFDTARTTFGQITIAGLLRQFPATFAATNLVRGPDGDIWFITSQSATPLGKIATDGTISTYGSKKTPVSLYGLTPGTDGRMYFLADVNSGLELGRIATDGTGLTYIPTGLGAGPLAYFGLYAGADGNFYTIQAAELGGNAVLERITPSGAPTTTCGSYTVATVGTVLADGTLMFVAPANNGNGGAIVGAIQPTGLCVSAQVPAAAGLQNLVYPVVGLTPGYFYAYAPSSSALVRFAY